MVFLGKVSRFKRAAPLELDLSRKCLPVRVLVIGSKSSMHCLVAVVGDLRQATFPVRNCTTRRHATARNQLRPKALDCTTQAQYMCLLVQCVTLRPELGTRNEGGRQTQRTQGQGRLNHLSEARPTSSRSSTSRASPASGREFFWRGGVSSPARSRMRSRFRRRAISRNRKAPTSAPGGALSPVISHSRSTGSSASGHPLPPHNRSPARRPAHAPRPTPILGGLPHTKYNRSARSASTDPRIKLSRWGKHDELVFMMMAVTSDHAPAEMAPWSRTRSAHRKAALGRKFTSLQQFPRF